MNTFTPGQLLVVTRACALTKLWGQTAVFERRSTTFSTGIWVRFPDEVLRHLYETSVEPKIRTSATPIRSHVHA